MNEKQCSAVDAFIRRESIFLTGSAGTGKSFTLKEICRVARTLHLKVGLTATSGSAAHLIGGRTLHSFLSIGLAKQSAQTLAAQTRQKYKPTYKSIRALDVLIIEEISMMDMELFEKVSDYLSLIRENSKPFGGLQVLFIGDFCQLPPVRMTKFCFKSQIWQQMKMTTIMLTESVRHLSDPILKRVLEMVRWGKCDKATLELIKTFGPTAANPAPEGLIPTRLYPTNVNVDLINDTEIAKLIDQGVASETFQTTYNGSPTGSRRWAASNKIPENVTLCIGAQVVVTWNVNQEAGIFNGTRGIVTALKPLSIQVRNGQTVQIDRITVTDQDSSGGGSGNSGNHHNSISYIPLRLAYALTIHRCQGMTLDYVEVDLGSSIFEYGQAYTALSRVRDTASMKVLEVSMSSFRCHPDVIEFYKNIVSIV